VGRAAATGGVVGPTPGRCHGYAENQATWPLTLENRNQWKFAVNSKQDNTRVLSFGSSEECIPRSNDSGQSFCVEEAPRVQATSASRPTAARSGLY